MPCDSNPPECESACSYPAGSFLGQVSASSGLEMSQNRTALPFQTVANLYGKDSVQTFSLSLPTLHLVLPMRACHKMKESTLLSSLPSPTLPKSSGGF